MGENCGRERVEGQRQQSRPEARRFAGPQKDQDRPPTGDYDEGRSREPANKFRIWIGSGQKVGADRTINWALTQV